MPGRPAAAPAPAPRFGRRLPFPSWLTGSRRLLTELAVAAVLVPLACVFLGARPGLADLNRLVRDRILDLCAASASGDVVIVGIDRKSLEALGTWPWPREVHARALETIAGAAPRALLLDLRFDIPYSNREVDDRIQQAVGRSRTFLVDHGGPVEIVGPQPGPVAPRRPLFAEVATAVGHLAVAPDSDGIVRRVELLRQSGDWTYPYLPWLVADKVPRDISRHPARMARGRTVEFPFARDPTGYRTLSYVDVLYGRVLPEDFKNKYVLVGFTGQTSYSRARPVGGIFPIQSLSDVEIHANALDAFLGRREIAEPGALAQFLAVAAPVWMVLLFLVRTGRPVLAFAIAAVPTIGSAYLSFCLMHSRLDLASALVGVAVACVMWTWRRHAAMLAYVEQRSMSLLHIAGAGPSPPQVGGGRPHLDSSQRKIQVLDQAIERVSHLYAVLSKGMEKMPVAVLLCDGRGIILQHNAAAEQLFGLLVPDISDSDAPSAAFVGKHLFGLLGRHTNSHAFEAAGGDFLWAEAEKGEFETRSGRVFRLRAEAVASGPGPGQVQWVVALPEFTAERRSLRERENWFQFLSHDIRSPQSTILGSVELFRATADAAAISPATQALLATVRKEADRTLRLTESFMAMLRAGSRAYQFAEIELAALVQDAVDEAWSYAAMRKVTLNARLSGAEDMVLLADAALMCRALVNLLNNAVRHSPKGGVVEVQVARGTGGGQPAAIVAVRDRGEGMTPQQVTRLFSRRPVERRRAVRVSEYAERGWGIGLSIVFTVVGNHGGSVEAFSSVGEGSTIVLTLPLAR